MYTLGIDLGGTNARAAVVAPDGQLVSVAKNTLEDRHPDAVVSAVVKAVQAALHQAPGAKPTAYGAGVAAQLDPAAGRVRVAPNLGWRDVPLGGLLEKALGHPVLLVNDLSAAAYGELHAGAGRGVKDTLTVFVGSGVGSAIISRGWLVEGASGVAGELGHIKVVPEGGRLCGCGEHGCLEAYAGGHHLIEQSRALVESGRSPILRELCGGALDRLNPALLERAAEAGDDAANEVYQRALGFLSVSVANAVTWTNPARLILGGGVLINCPGMRATLEANVARYGSRVSQTNFQIVQAQLGDDSGLVGSGLLAAANA